MLTGEPLTCTKMTARPAYLPADKVEEAVSGGDPVDVVGLVPRAVVHPHQHVPLGVAVAAVSIDAVISKRGMNFSQLKIEQIAKCYRACKNCTFYYCLQSYYMYLAFQQFYILSV